MSIGVSVRIFGAVRVVVDGREQEVRRSRERHVLAALVAAHGRSASADRLVLAVWGAQAAPEAMASLQVAVARLRVLLEPDRPARAPATRLVSTASGYALALEDDAVDAWMFERLLARAQGAPTPMDRLAAADAADAIWTGSPFAGCDGAQVRQEADRLAELYAQVQRCRGQALLDLDQPERAVTTLTPIAAANPFRERLWGLLALAQYRSAQQSDALDTLRRLRKRLAEELGIDPSPEITELEGAVLRQDASLQWRPRPAAPAAPIELARSVAAGPKAGVPEPATVGRDAVVARLRETIGELTSTGRGGFLLVTGEPGIGKSRLVADLGSMAIAAGGQVLVGHAHEAAGASPLGLWMSVLAGLGDDAAAEPHLASLLTDTAAADSGAGGVLRLFDAIIRALVRAAGRQATLVVLEDLHWADTTSLRMLGHLAASGIQGPLLVACTLRSADAPGGDALLACTAQMARAGTARIRLDGLSPAAIAALLGEALGEHDPRIDVTVAEATGGNPFYALEYARLVRAGWDHLDPAHLPVPDGVRDVLRQRLARLPDEARQILRIAAVAAVTIDPGMLGDLAGMGVDRVLDLLDLALASGLLVDRPDGYAFAHTLTREAVAADLSAAARMRLHDRIAHVWHEREGDDPDAAMPIAFHAHLAAPLGAQFAARACVAQARAARVAEARLAHDEALLYWRRAGEWARTPAERVEAWCGQAFALVRLARMGEARSLVVDAVRLAVRWALWQHVPPAVSILNQAGVWTWREHGVRDDAFVAALQEALPHVSDAGRARILAALQTEHFYAWDSARAKEFGRRALAIAQDGGGPALTIEVLLAGILASFGPGQAISRLAHVEQLRALPLTGEQAVFAESFYARTLYECGRVPEADEAAARCAAAAATLRHTGVEIPTAWWFVARARDRDDAAAAARVLASAPLSEQAGGQGAELALWRALRSRPDGAPLPPEVIQGSRPLPAGMRAMVAFEVAESGDPIGAVDVLGAPAPAGASDYTVLAGDCLRVEVLARAGDLDGVAGALGRIAPYHGDVVTYGSVDHLGVVDYFLAAGHAALGDVDVARELCDAACAQLASLDNRPWLRRAQALALQLGTGGGQSAHGGR